MAITGIGINGRGIEEFGIKPINLEGYLAPPEINYGSVDLIDVIGSTTTVRGSRWKARELLLGVMTTSGVSIANSRSLLNDWHKACRGLLEVEIIDAPGKVCYGVFEGASEGVDGVKLVSTDLKSIGRIVCRDPIWYTRLPQMVSAAAAARVEVPCGSAPGIVKFMVIGAATNPVVTLRSRTGEILQQMTFTVSLGATEAIEVDRRAAWPVTRWTAGVATNGFSLLAITDTLIRVDPLDGATLETSAGSLVVTTWIGDLT